MSRPNLAARPTRDVAGVVAEMLGTDEAVITHSQKMVKTSVPRSGKTGKGQTVNTALLREKTSFAIRPAIKRHLTLLKLDLREAGHRVTEAEIVEALIARADANTLAKTFQAEGKRANRRDS